MFDTAWGNLEKTVVIYTAVEPWTGEEWYQAVIACNKLIDEVPHNVDLIYDFTHSQDYFDVRGVLSRGREVTRINRTDRAKRVVLVKVNPLFRTTVSVIQKIFIRESQRMYFVDTVEEALKLLGIEHIPDDPKMIGNGLMPVYEMEWIEPMDVPGNDGEEHGTSTVI